jgi:hypothetical protein
MFTIMYVTGITLSDYQADVDSYTLNVTVRC